MSKKVQARKNSNREVAVKAASKFDRVLPLWAVSIIFLLTTLIFFWPQLQGEAFFWEDFVKYVYPYQTYAARAFAEGDIPQWNPYVFGGMPFLADLQVGFFYPFNRLLSLGVDEAGQLSPWLLQAVVIFHFFIAQLGTYLFCRYLKLSSYSSLIPAVSFAFSFAMVMHVIHPMVIFHLTWLPWVAWMLLASIDRHSLRYGAIGGLILGMSFLAGHPQTALYEGLFLGLMMLWRWFDRPNLSDGLDIQKRDDEWKRWVAPIATFLIAGGMFAIQLLPTQELADSARRADADYEYVTEGSMMMSDLGKFVVPSIKGQVDFEDRMMYYFENAEGQTDRGKQYFYWEKGMYVGLAALVLAFTAFILMYKHPFVRFLLFFTILGTLFAFGSNGFVFDIFYQLPLFDTFRFPIRMMFLVMFSLSLAAGFAIDRLKNVTGDGGKKEIIVVNSVLAFFIVIAMLIWSGSFNISLAVPEELSPKLKEHAGGVLVSLFILGFMLAALYYHKVRNGVAISLVFLFAFFDLYIQGSQFNANPENGYESYEIAPEFKRSFAIKPPEEIFRVNIRKYGQNPIPPVFQQNQGLVSNIMLIEGYNPLLLERINPSFNTSGEMYGDIRGALNVRYEIGIDRPTGAPRFYERRKDIASAWIVREVEIAQSKEEAEQIMSAWPENSFRKRAVVESEQEGKSVQFQSGSFQGTGESDDVRITKWENDYIKYDARAASPGLLVFSEIFYPAWNAYIDGEEVPMYIADGSLRAVELPEGEHEVELIYESPALATGTIITLVSALVAILIIVLVRDDKPVHFRE